MTPEQIEAIAGVCHEANRAYCKSIGDYSQMPWEAAPQEIQASAICGVQLYVDKPLTTPERAHENWLAAKEAEGWRYGESKDFQEKTHPCFRPYWELPADQRAKDALFGAIAKALILAQHDAELEANADKELAP